MSQEAIRTDEFLTMKNLTIMGLWDESTPKSKNFVKQQRVW